MRTHLILMSICSLAFLGACGGDEPSQNNSSPDAGSHADAEPDSSEDDTGLDGGDGGSTSTPYPDDISFTDYREALIEVQVDLICTFAWQCESTLVNDGVVGRRFASEESCRDELPDSPHLRALFDRDTEEQDKLVDDGRIIYDSEAAAECLNYFVDTSTADMCDIDHVLAGLEACGQENVLTGTIGEGGSCDIGLECADDSAYCSSSQGTDERTCEFYECDGEVCGDDEYCKRNQDDGSRSCEPLKTEGASCESSQACGMEMSCLILEGESSGVCLSRGARDRGETCSSHFYCGEADMCVDETCEAFEFLDEDDACEPSDICEPGTLCLMSSVDAVVGTCKPPSDVGDRCKYADDCQFGLYCDRESSDEMGSCARPKSDGATCRYNAECESALCESDTCGAD